jgi:hypothetical protein
MESYQHDPKHAANTNNASRRRPLPQDTTQLITESFTEHANNKDSHLTVLCALYLPVLGLPRRETGESRRHRRISMGDGDMDVTGTLGPRQPASCTACGAR